MINPTTYKTKKHFGQHFLNNPQIITNIVNAIPLKEHQTLIEIGPGQGAITMPILDKYKKLTAIELDRDLINSLTVNSKLHGDLTLINADILTVDFSSLFEDKSLCIVGNLPYNISTPLLFHLLDSTSIISSMTFMVQQEVANRITAEVGSKAYGRLSIMMQYYCQSHYLFHVPPESFTPPPKVDSAVIQLIPHEHKNDVLISKSNLNKIVKSAFSQRRKTIRNSLSEFLTAEQIESAEIKSNLRAENLSLDQFITLSNLLP